jgi:hypothetical protein
MPLAIKSTEGGLAHAPVFVTGPLATDTVKVDISTLTSDEIDSDGYLKPGVPFSSAGVLVAAMTRSTPGSATPGGENTGDGAMGAATGGFGAPSETITLTITSESSNAGGFKVEGSKSGFIGTGNVASAFASDIISFTLADGSEDFDIGDTFTWEVTGGTSDAVYGVTIAPVKVADGNGSTERNAATDCFVAVGTHGVVNRDIMEDNLGRSLTAAEIAGFEQSNITLTRT